MKKFFWLFLAPASASSLLAQTPAPVATQPLAPELPRTTTTMLNAMFQSGRVMVVLLVLSIISVMLVIVYFLSIRRGASVSHGFMATADALLRKRDYLGLLAVSNRHGEAIARVVQQVLYFTTKNPKADVEQIREIDQTEETRVGSHLNNRVTYHADIGMIVPLLGLLGTVIVIIRSYVSLGSDVFSQRYMQLSHGISEALFNTAAGLAIGIPAMIFYAFFRGRSQRLISELESAVTHILALLSLQFARGSERTPALLESEF